MEQERNGLGQAGIRKESPNVRVVAMIALVRAAPFALLFKRGIWFGIVLVLVLVLVIMVMMHDVKDRFHIFQVVKRQDQEQSDDKA